MSTSPRSQRRSRRLARAAFVVAAVFVGVSSATAVAGLDPVVGQDTGSDEVSTVPPQPVTIQEPEVDPAATQNPCSRYPADFCVEVPQVAAQVLAPDSSCTLVGEHSPTGDLEVIPGVGGNSEVDNSIAIRLEVEGGLAVDTGCWADAVLEILQDDRGWGGIHNVSFARVDDDYDLRLVLASPDTTDDLCYPANTAGLYSCRRQDVVVINLMRWESGTDDYADDLDLYRTYLINHEVGHYLGRGHINCPAAGEPAPVMMQQTKGLGECIPNGWPTKDEGE